MARRDDRAIRLSAFIVAAFAGLLAFRAVIGGSDHWASVVAGLLSAALVAAAVYTLALVACERPRGGPPTADD